MTADERAGATNGAWPEEIPCALREEARDWCRVWGDESIADTTRIVMSARMRRTLGCALRRTRVVRLNRVLIHPECAALLREVLCHELAHVLVVARCGASARPHGPEWRAAMAAQGFSPRITIPATELPAVLRYLASSPRRGRTRRRRTLRRTLAQRIRDLVPKLRGAVR